MVPDHNAGFAKALTRVTDAAEHGDRAMAALSRASSSGLVAGGITTTVAHCARCHGHRHHDLVFRPLAHPIEAEPGVAAYTFTHWAPCPTNGEPILMLITEVESDG